MSSKILVLSDTHGLVRTSLSSLLETSDLVIHAGDFDNPETFNQFKLASKEFRGVRGNCDYGLWSEELPPFDFFEFNNRTFYVKHIPHLVDIDPWSAGVDVLITGHTHHSEIKSEKGLLYVNPGSAGPSPPHRKATAILVKIDSEKIIPEIIEL